GRCKSPSGQDCFALGAGISAFFYQQITGDSGSGAARVGSFEAMTTGIGPVVSYAQRFGYLDVGSEVQWLPELSVSNRLSGNIIWLKFAFSWGSKPAAAPMQAL